MPPFRLPLAEVQTLRDFVGRSPSDRRAFFEALSHAPPALRPQVLAKNMGEVDGFDRDFATEAVFVMYTVHAILDYYERDSAALGKELTQAVNSNDLENVVAESTVIEFVEEVRSLRSLRVSAKALRLLNQQQKAFVTSSILSDVRPVFDVDGEVKDTGYAVVVHQMKIEFRESDELQQVFFAMDLDDLRSLSKSIERALKKHEYLIDTLAEQQTTILDPERLTSA